MSRTTYFVDVILPLAVPNLYTYRVPYDWNNAIAIGKRVVVQFGKGKLYSALVRSVHQTPPKQYEAKYIEYVLDEHPVVNSKQLELWDWISTYYMCTPGDVMIAALPGGLRLTSETKIILHSSYNKQTSAVELNDKEYLIVEALEIRQTLSIQDVEQIIEQKTVYPVIKTLIEKGIVVIQEELKEKYKPKIETFVRITPHADDENNLKTIFSALEKKASKQLDVLLAYIKLSGRYQALTKQSTYKEVKKSELLKLVEGAEAALKALAKKNILELYERETGRFASYEYVQQNFVLNDVQQQVYETILNHFGWLKNNIDVPEKQTVLLHGVTSSGKTEIYIRLIEQAITKGQQVLYLLPEIALTTQIINRLRKRFGNDVGVYHSKFNENERVEVWNAVLQEPRTKNQEPRTNNQELTTNSQPEPAEGQQPKYKLVIGARSALFLPFSNLGLIIVDEEHDSSYKQYDPAPRYNARDAALYLAHIHKAKVVLGSATPSVESYYNAQEGKYGLVELLHRYGGLQMPEILIADVKEATKKKLMKSHFAPELLDAVTQSLTNKEQVILFQNRRGFAPQLECNTCAWVPQCVNCDVSLTYHKTSNQLRCHYCGYSMKPPDRCAACGDTDLKTKGFGTEKIEEELAIYFPNAKIARMDLDTTRSKFAHQHIIQNFEDHTIDILVGTQMITKGLDFDNVSLVGILNADSMLNFPDFRSFERSYQLMAQVSGRAGRKNKRGKVIIQTHNPEHSIIQNVVNNDYATMYVNQLLDRKNFNYPPFFRLVEITLIHKDVDMVNSSAKFLADELKRYFKERVLGPEFPIVARVRNLYQKTILLKIEREASVVQAKKIVSELLVHFKSGEYKAVRVQMDVDPL